ncbi:MAG: pyruvate synthase subunit beta [Deltaproteobacteria bacterium]|nr:pyruvate synthase subunit beta [Deltaproteobacteria bacterium]
MPKLAPCDNRFSRNSDWHISSAEFMAGGHMACPGCGASLSMRHALKVLGAQTIVVMPACCWAIIAGGQPTTALSVPLLHTPFAVAAAAASGVRRALLAQRKNDVEVMVWAGDGGTFDIGLQGISGAAERQEDMIYVCYDNEAYMNTGIQRSSATPHGAWTTTTPGGKKFAFGKKDILAIIRAHQPAYLASATIAYPEDFYAKFEKARQARGFRFLHLLAACPSGWKIDSQDALKVTRMAVDSGVFPLLEMEAGGGLRRTVKPERPIPVKDYLEAQGRFKKMPAEEIAAWQKEIEAKEII